MSADDKAAAAWNDYVSQQQEEKIEELERQLNAANERIKRLEDAGDAMHWAFSHHDTGNESVANAWRKAKEAKP
jgi:inosine/xanthosine triphosphate pyrophosphatase family protein